MILFFLPIWGAVVLWSVFVDHKLPDTTMMMIPSAIIVAVAPAWRRPRASSSDNNAGEQPAESEA